MVSYTAFTPAFEGNWTYQSFLLLPTDAQLTAVAGADINAKKWAMGGLLLADGVEMEAAGQLTFAPGVELKVHVTFTPDQDGRSAEFKATGMGVDGPTKGAVYELIGWALPDAAGNLLGVRGSVRAAQGPDTKPESELGGMPIGTVGAFTITR